MQIKSIVFFNSFRSLLNFFLLFYPLLNEWLTSTIIIVINLFLLSDLLIFASCVFKFLLGTEMIGILYALDKLPLYLFIPFNIFDVKSTSSDVNIATPVFFRIMWYNLFHPFSFNLFVFIFKVVFGEYRKIVGCFFIQPDNLCFLFEVFQLFLFNEINIGFNSIIFLFSICPILHIFYFFVN